MSEFDSQLKQLAEPFPPEDIEWRISQVGTNSKGVWAKCLAYLTSRAVMDRLDNTVGPENWRNEFVNLGKAILCGLSVRVGDEWVTKWDGAEATDIEPVKGGLSGALKRAAVQWGIGRYLYHLPEGWANIHDGGTHYQRGKKGEYEAFKWDPPGLPVWAQPGGDGRPMPQDFQQRTRQVVNETAAPNLEAPPPSSPPPSGSRLRFNMDEQPSFKSGHVFAKGPHREKWNGWTWKQCAEAHRDALYWGQPNADNSPIQNMIENEQYIKGWNREQAEMIDKMACKQIDEGWRPEGHDAPPQEEEIPGAETDLSDVPF